MYAVIETGGKQYRVTPGEQLEIETLAGDAGAEVEFGRVLAVVDGDSVKAGRTPAAARVKGADHRARPRRKTIVFKFKRKKQYQAHHRASPELHPR